MGKQGGILQVWFKNFIIIVFTQSFHAIFLAFIIQIVGDISVNIESLNFTADTIGEAVTDAKSEGVLAIVSMVSIMALIKMEKMIKSIFGIEDSKFLGGVGDNFARSMAGIKSGVSMAKRTAEPIKDIKASNDRIRKARTGQQRAMDTINSIGTGKGGSGSSNSGGSGNTNINIDNGKKNNKSPEFLAGELYGKALDAKKSGDMDSYNKYMKEAAKNLKDSRTSDRQIASGSTSTIGAPTIDKATNDKISAAKKSLQENKIEEELAKADRKNAAIRAFTRAGSTAAALAFGMGATDNIADAATVANLVDAPLDVVSDRFSAKQAYGSAGKKLSKDLEEARKQAIENIKKENPELEEDSVEFKAKVNVAVRTEMDAKLAVDSKIPQSARKEAAKVWKEAGSSIKRDARRYANDISRNGVTYGDTNIDDI